MWKLLLDVIPAVAYFATSAYLFIALQSGIRIAWICAIGFLIECLNFGFHAVTLRNNEDRRFPMSFLERVESFYMRAPVALLFGTLLSLATFFGVIFHPIAASYYDRKPAIEVAFTAITAFAIFLSTLSFMHKAGEVYLLRSSLDIKRRVEVCRQVVIALTLAVTGVLQGLMLYSSCALIVDMNQNPYIGRLYTVPACGNCQMHMICKEPSTFDPATQATVVYFHGYRGSALDAMHLVGNVVQSTKICTYDRAGYGWSQVSKSTNPRDVKQQATEALSLLKVAGISGNVILTGHSYGAGFLIPEFVNQTLENSAHNLTLKGVVLIDPVDPAKETRDANKERTVDSLYTVNYYLAPLGISRIAIENGYIPQADLLKELPSNYGTMARKNLENEAFVLAASGEQKAWYKSAFEAYNAVYSRTPFLGYYIPLVVVAATGPATSSSSAGLNNVDTVNWAGNASLITVNTAHGVPFYASSATIVANQIVQMEAITRS